MVKLWLFLHPWVLYFRHNFQETHDYECVKCMVRNYFTWDWTTFATHRHIIPVGDHCYNIFVNMAASSAHHNNETVYKHLLVWRSSVKFYNFHVQICVIIITVRTSFRKLECNTFLFWKGAYIPIPGLQIGHDRYCIMTLWHSGDAKMSILLRTGRGGTDLDMTYYCHK